jgi:hypothetical protein
MRSILLLCAVLLACTARADRKDAGNMAEHKPSDLEARLVAAGYDGLFLSGDRSRAEAIWAQGKNQSALQAIVLDGKAMLHGKFLAAELLRDRGVKLPADAAPVLAEAYARALATTSDTAGNPWRLNGNVWGFAQHADDPGHLGAVLVGLDKAAVPPLTRLLDDAGPIFFEGSREAMTGNRLKLRVKDFAAYYLGKIENIAVPLHPDHPARDAEIEKLKVTLAAHAKK